MKKVIYYSSASSIKGQFYSLFKVNLQVISEEYFDHYNHFCFKVLFVNAVMMELLLKYGKRGYSVCVCANNGYLTIVIDTPFK